MISQSFCFVFRNLHMPGKFAADWLSYMWLINIHSDPIALNAHWLKITCKSHVTQLRTMLIG